MFFPKRTTPVLIKDDTWRRVLSLSLVLFFIYFGDAILSFWAPNLVQNALSSPAIIGLVLSFSSIVGFGADLILPQILTSITVKRLVMLGIASSMVFSFVLYGTTYFPLVLLFLFGMAVWGIYYEFLGFAGQQFVADSVPLKLHSASWGVISIFKNLAYFLGPFLASALLMVNERFPAYLAVFFAFIALMFLNFSGKTHHRKMEIDVKEVNLLRELEHWFVLFKHVWPVVLLSVFLGLIDATFWTTGAVWTEKLAQTDVLGKLFLPLYTLPSLFVGFLVARWKVTHEKKKLAEIFTLLAGVFLALIGLSDFVPWQLAMVFASSTILAIACPLTDGIYSDIVCRMGRERKHMIGLSNSTKSFAYIIGPILAGVIASVVGERLTFSVIGMAVILIAIVLLAFSPKLMLLPQGEIKSWE